MLTKGRTVVNRKCTKKVLRHILEQNLNIEVVMENMNEMRRMNRIYGYVAVMHAVPDALAVDVYADNTLIAENLAFGTYTNYIKVPAQSYQITVYVSGTRMNPVITKMLIVGKGEFLTAVAVGTIATIDLVAIEDADVPRIEDKALIRFAHLSPNAPAVDITLPDGTKLFSDVTFKEVTEYIAVDQMNYTLQVRLAGTDTMVLVVPNVNVRNNNYYTVYAVGLVGQQPELEALLVQDGEIK